MEVLGSAVCGVGGLGVRVLGPGTLVGFGVTRAGNNHCNTGKTCLTALTIRVGCSMRKSPHIWGARQASEGNTELHTIRDTSRGARLSPNPKPWVFF